jgi:uncharacterized protein YjbI with pentapeptide repeats
LLLRDFLLQKKLISRGLIGRKNVVAGEVPDLSDAYVPYAMLSGANLSGAVLTGADLSGANMVDANLIDADLIEAKLNGTALNGAKLNGAKLNGAILDRADLRGAKNITKAQLSAACGKDVMLDPGLTIKPCPER